MQALDVDRTWSRTYSDSGRPSVGIYVTTSSEVHIRSKTGRGFWTVT
jgi:hypothetical protein